MNGLVVLAFNEGGGCEMSHKHTILEITEELWCENMELQLTNIVMDCPVSPSKIVVTTAPLHAGEVFDPHFSNDKVIARFRPNEQGWLDGLMFLGE